MEWDEKGGLWLCGSGEEGQTRREDGVQLVLLKYFLVIVPLMELRTTGVEQKYM